MRRFAPFLAVALILALAVAGFGWWQLRPPGPLPPLSDEFGLVDVTIINPQFDRKDHQVLAVKEGQIHHISNLVADAGSKPLTEYRRHFVLPGLIDLHSHLPPDNALHLSGHSLLLYLAYGVTTIREVGDVDGTAVDGARDEEGSGYAGPHIYACGPFVAGGPPRWKNTLVLQQPQDADHIVQTIEKEGFDCVKSYDDLTAAEILAVLDAARRSGLPVLGHVPIAVAYEEALVSEVQHLHGVALPKDLDANNPLTRMLDWDAVDSARITQFVQSTRARGIAHTPTLVSHQQLLLYQDYAAARQQPYALMMPRLYRDVVWSPTDGLPALRLLDPAALAKLKSAFEKKREVVRQLFQAGAQLYIGTDVLQPFVVPGISVQQEMKLFVESGVPLANVWAMATWQAADALRQPDLGRVRRGAPADFLVFREDPTQSLEALGSLEAVVARGKLYRRADLQAEIARYQTHFDNWVFDQISVRAARRMVQRAVTQPDAH